MLHIICIYPGFFKIFSLDTSHELHIIKTKSSKSTSDTQNIQENIPPAITNKTSLQSNEENKLDSSIDVVNDLLTRAKVSCYFFH